MSSQILQSKLERYINGEAEPSETRQIQNWLSCTAKDIDIRPKDRRRMRKKIMKEILVNTGNFSTHFKK